MSLEGTEGNNPIGGVDDDNTLDNAMICSKYIYMYVSFANV